VQIGELRESEKPLRCAYCHSAADLDPVVCPGCGTGLHPECVGNLSRCPTLGCTSRLTTRSGPPRFPWVRTVLGTFLLAGAVAVVVNAKPHCDPALNPGCKKGEVAALCQAVVIGVPGLCLLLPAFRLLLAGQMVRVVSIVVGSLTLALALPLIFTVLDLFERIERLQVGWFSYTMSGWSLGDPDFEKTYPSTHALLVLIVLLRLASGLLPRRAEMLRAQVQVEKTT